MIADDQIESMLNDAVAQGATADQVRELHGRLSNMPQSAPDKSSLAMQAVSNPDTSIAARLTAYGANAISQIPGLKELGSLEAAALGAGRGSTISDRYADLEESQKSMREAGQKVDPGPTSVGNISGNLLGAGLGGKLVSAIAPESTVAFSKYAAANPYKASVALGAPLGGIYGAASGDDAASRIANAAVGAGVGAVASPLLTAAGRNIVEPAIGKLAQITGSSVNPEDLLPAKVQQKAKDLLTQAMKIEGIKPDDIADRLEEAQKTKLPLTALDVTTQNVGGVQTHGRNLLGLADAAANMPGEGAAMAGDVAERGTTAKQRIGQAFDQFISSGKPYQVTDDALNRMVTEARPAYEKAFSQGPVYSDRIGQMLKSPEINKGISRGMQIQRIEAMASGKPFDPVDYGITGFNEAGDPVISGTPNMRLLDAGKQGLDAMIGEETNDLTGKMTQMGRALTQLKKSYVGELDNLNPDYAAARNAYGSQASRLQSLKDGVNFMQQNPEEIKRFFEDKNTSLADQMAYSVGVRQKLQDVMSQVGDNANAITRLWKQGIRDRLDPMFGDKDAFAQFSDIMQHEQNMARVNGILTRGSQTMPRQEYAAAIQQPATNIGKIIGAIANPKGAAIQAGAGMLNNQMQKSASKMSNGTAAEIMRYLTSNDPDLWRNFNRLPAQKSAISAYAAPLLTTESQNALRQKTGGLIAEKKDKTIKKPKSKTHVTVSVFRPVPDDFQPLPTR